MAVTLNPTLSGFTLKQRDRQRKSAGVEISDTYFGPVSAMAAFLAANDYGSAHPSHAGSVLDRIQERYDENNLTSVYLTLTYIPGATSMSSTPFRPIGSVVIEAEPVTEDVSIDQWVAEGGSASDFAEGETSKARAAVQVTVAVTERSWAWTQAAVKALATGTPTPAAYFSGPLTAAAWTAAGCRVREGDGVAEKTQVWMFRPSKA
jgi:hypothetical protein